jgi:hypothetical protein
VTCADSLIFLEDLTIPDGTRVEMGVKLDKRWRVENAGSCNWDQDYRLKLVTGPPMSAQTEQALFPARSGTEATIRILFTAPMDPGTYRSAWQAFNPAGEAFGESIYIEIVVEATSPTPAPTEPSSDDAGSG